MPRNQQSGHTNALNWILWTVIALFIVLWLTSAIGGAILATTIVIACLVIIYFVVTGVRKLRGGQP
jgi:hypothetical protein